MLGILHSYEDSRGNKRWTINKETVEKSKKTDASSVVFSIFGFIVIVLLLIYIIFVLTGRVKIDPYNRDPYY